MAKKIKFIIDKDYITILFPSKSGGAKTLYKSDSLFETVKSLLEDRNIFTRVFHSVQKKIQGTFEGLETKVKKIDCIRDAINALILEQSRFNFDIRNIASYFKCNGVDSKRIRNVIIDNIYKCLNNEKTLDEVSDEVYANEFEYMRVLFDKTALIEKSFKGTSISIREGYLYYKDEQLPEDSLLVRHVIKSLLLGVKSNSYLNFLDRVMANEKTDIRKELFLFLENGTFPIHEDGRFSAYKKITLDRKDFYTRKVDHIEGEMLPRLTKKDVDFDRECVCSKGYHFCAYDYLREYRSVDGYILIEVIIDPVDVLAIPSDYANKKGRAFTYEIGPELFSKDRSLEETQKNIFDSDNEICDNSIVEDDEDEDDEDCSDGDYYDEDEYDED